jgi:hypothetical protein
MKIESSSHESHNFVLKIDQRGFERYPPPSILVLCISGFAIVQIVGFDFREAKLGDIVVGVALFRFSIMATIWLLTSIENWSWVLLYT